MRLLNTYIKKQCIKAMVIPKAAQGAYAWIMQAPWHKRLLRLWCVKHSGHAYKTSYDWLSAPD